VIFDTVVQTFAIDDEMLGYGHHTMESDEMLGYGHHTMESDVDYFSL